MDLGVAQLRIAQPGHRIVLVQPLLGPGGRLDMPLDQLQPERLGNLLGKHGFARAGFTLDQQRLLQTDRGINSHLQLIGCNVRLGSCKSHNFLLHK